MGLQAALMKPHNWRFRQLMLNAPNISGTAAPRVMAQANERFVTPGTYQEVNQPRRGHSVITVLTLRYIRKHLRMSLDYQLDRGPGSTATVSTV